MKYSNEDLNFISKENFHSYNNDSHVLTQSEKGFSSLKNLLSNMKDGNFSVMNSKDHLKNKKLVLHLREKMFRGFIKTKILSERRKLKSAANGESTDFNFMRDFKIEGNSETGSKIYNVSKQNPFGFSIKNYKNFSHLNNTRERGINNKPKTHEKVFITDRENEVPAFLNNLIEYNIDTNPKDSNYNYQDEASIKRKIFKDSFEARQYQKINFVAFEINGPPSNKNKNLNLNKANIKRDIVKQIQSLDKIYSARSKDIRIEKIKILDLDKESNLQPLHESRQNFSLDKNSSKAFKETWLKDKFNYRTISAIKPYNNIALRKREENSKIFRNSTALYRKREDIVNININSHCNYSSSLDPRKNNALNSITNFKNKNIISSPRTGVCVKIRPKTETKVTIPIVKGLNDNIFSNVMLRDSLEVNPRKVDYIHLQKYKVNMNFIDIRKDNNEDFVSVNKERNFFDNQRMLHMNNKQKRLNENKMVQTDFKNLMSNRKEKFQKLKDSVFDFSKVHILHDSIKSPFYKNQISNNINKKIKDGNNKAGDIHYIRENRK